MPPWAIVTQDNKLLNSSSFRTATTNSCALRALILSGKISYTYDNSPVISRYSYRFLSFYGHYTSKEKR